MVEANENNLNLLLVGSNEAARLLGMSRRSLERIDSNGKLGVLPVKILDGRNLWSVEELRDWVQAKCPSRAIWQSQQKQKTE